MDQTKAAISIAEMARAVGLSRARFYQLMGTTFPWPVYSVSNHRPYYDQKMQNLCLEVRRRNCGIDGKPVLFYAKRIGTTNPIRKSRKTAPPPSPPPKIEPGHDDILDGLRSLGLATATLPQVTDAVRELFPGGVNNENRGQVLRAVFLRLRRQDTADNVRR